jgi:outer membrane protein OmpA-like peptidoglycan-associated protein
MTGNILIWAKIGCGDIARLRRVAAAAICLLAGVVASPAISRQSGSVQQPAGAVQTAPIDEPDNAPEKPKGPHVSKGIKAIQQRDTKCATTFIVSADALFAVDRWTLNPDAAETLDVLGPLIAKAGKHPAQIDAFTDSVGSDSDNQILTEKRALTVRGWLVNHGFVPEGTPVRGFGKQNPVDSNSKPNGADNPLGRQKNRRIEVVIDTCR